jgi:hypothetical protein
MSDAMAGSPQTAETSDVHGYNPSARLEYLQSILPPKKKRRWVKWLVVLVVLAAAAFVVFQLLAGHAAAPAKTTATPKTTPVSTQPAPITTQNYESTDFNLSLDYPDTWTLNDKTTDLLTMTSPKLQLKTTSGKVVSGKIVVTMTPGGKNLNGFDQGNGTAVRDSQKIKYKKPTEVQRAETYLTFVRFADTEQQGIDTIIVTGDFGYQDGQAVPQIDMSKLGLVIQATFVQCAKTDCTMTTPLVANASNWDDQAVQKPVLAIIESLSVN